MREFNTFLWKREQRNYQKKEVWLKSNPTYAPGPCPERFFFSSRDSHKVQLAQWGIYWGALFIDILLLSTAERHLALKRELLVRMGLTRCIAEIRDEPFNPDICVWALRGTQTWNLSIPSLFIIIRLLGFKLRLYHLLCDLGHINHFFIYKMGW